MRSALQNTALLGQLSVPRRYTGRKRQGKLEWETQDKTRRQQLENSDGD